MSFLLTWSVWIHMTDEVKEAGHFVTFLKQSSFLVNRKQVLNLSKNLKWLILCNMLLKGEFILTFTISLNEVQNPLTIS